VSHTRPRELSGRSFELVQDLGYFHANHPIGADFGPARLALRRCLDCPIVLRRLPCAKIVREAMLARHNWIFKSHVRSGAFGWKGSHLAGERLKAAVTEIRKVATVDPVTTAALA